MALHAFSIGHGSADDPTLLLNRPRYSDGPTLRGAAVVTGRWGEHFDYASVTGEGRCDQRGLSAIFCQVCDQRALRKSSYFLLHKDELSPI